MIRDILTTGKSSGAGIARLLTAAAGRCAQTPRDQQVNSVAPAEPASTAPGLPPGAVAEYRFAPPRRWRFDYAWPGQHIALEIEGGVWTRGRHTRPAGFIRDLEKYNTATVLGWRVLRVTTEQFKSGEAGRLVAEVMRIKS